MTPDSSPERAGAAESQVGHGRSEGNNQDVIDKLVQALMATRPRDQFKPPKYDGSGDVELFIEQFQSVMQANDWGEAAARLHLQSVLEGGARGCSRGESVTDIFGALRARFGLTIRQAKDKLANLKRMAGQPLHELATECKRLVGIAYPALPVADREEMAVDYFVRSTDNKGLQRHMLAVMPNDVQEAVRAAEEYLQVGGVDRSGKPVARPTAMPVDNEDTTDWGADRSGDSMQAGLAAIGEVVKASLGEALKAQTEMMSEFLSRMEQSFGARPTASPHPSNGGESRRGGPRSVRPLTCFECGGPHLKRNCPRLTETENSGNEEGPAQL